MRQCRWMPVCGHLCRASCMICSLALVPVSDDVLPLLCPNRWCRAYAPPRQCCLRDVCFWAFVRLSTRQRLWLPVCCHLCRASRMMCGLALVRVCSGGCTPKVLLWCLVLFTFMLCSKLAMPPNAHARGTAECTRAANELECLRLKMTILLLFDSIDFNG